MSVKKNFIYNLSYQMLIMILPLITTPYISRVIGAEGIGLQAYTVSIVNYFVLFIMLGINNHGNRSIAMVRDNKEETSKTFVSIYFIQASMSILISIIYIIYASHAPTKYRTLFIIQYMYILSAMLDINWFFFGLEKFKLTVTRNIIIKIVSALCVFLFIEKSEDIYIYSLILALGQLISQVILWKYLIKEINFRKVSWRCIYKQIKPILILFVPVIAVSIYKIMDKIMLGAMGNIIQLGFYENSEKIINIPMGIITALATVMLPKMSNLQAKGDDKQSRKYISLSMQFAIFMSCGSAFGLLGISKVLIPIFLGPEFIDCISIVSILSINILFLSWANVIRTQYLIPRKKDKVFIRSTILGSICNLIINLILIPPLGAIGAAVGTTFAELAVAVYQTISVRNELDIKEYIRKSIFYFVPGIVMYFCVRFIGELMGNSLLTGLIQIIIGGTIYCFISLIYLIIIKDKNILNICKNIKKVKYKNI